jgi:hypothetical protein
MSGRANPFAGRTLAAWPTREEVVGVPHHGEAQRPQAAPPARSPRFGKLGGRHLENARPR